MTNTRKEVADTAIELMGYKKGYQDGIRHVAGLVAALKRIAESEYDYETGQHSNEIAEEALNNLPEELRR